MKTGDMSISAFSRRSLLSVKALRLYDESGLLRPNRVDARSGYRYYGEDQLEDARLISLLRRLDVPLAIIADLIVLPRDEMGERLASWWKQEEEQLARRQDLLRYIQGTILGERDIERDQDYTITLREVADSTYLYLSGNVSGPYLHDFIGRSAEYLFDRARNYGGAMGMATVVYHGIVDIDSDGPVEVCVPIRDASSPTGNDTIRTEVGHLQASIRLTRPQVAFPQILQVYQALRRWIGHNNLAISGPPREIYLGNFVEASSIEPICDVAFPVRKNKGE